MVIIFLLILVFLIYNFKTYENFSNTILSPIIKKINREKKYLDITFEKDVNDNIQPGDKYVYEIYYKSQDEVLEDEVLNGNINIQRDSWTLKEVECDSIKCNEIIYISDSNTYYFFILVRLGDKNSDKRSEIRQIIKSEGKNNSQLYSPDILQIKKNGSNCYVFFKRSGRDKSIPQDKMRYEIYYAREEDVDLTPSPSVETSPSPSDEISPSPSGKYDNWFRKVVICDKIKCTSKIQNLDADTYYFFIVQVKNGRKSMINNVVKVTDTEPYSPIEYSLEDYKSGFSFDEDTPCKEYPYDNCPDKLTGTILSRCYKDREFERCLPTLDEEYLQ